MTTTKKGTTEFISADELRVDKRTQRELRPAWVAKLAETWDDDQAGILEVSRRNGHFYVIDGQHRVFAKRLRGEGDQVLECKIRDDLTLGDEAQRFIRANDTKSVSAYDKFKVRLNYDEQAKAIHRIIKRAGLQLRSDNKDGCISAVTACDDVYSGKLLGGVTETTPWALENTLTVLTGVWGMDRNAVNANVVRGVGAVFLRYGDEIDITHLTHALANFKGGPVVLMARGRTRREMTAGTLWRAIAEYVVDIYNKGRRKSALPQFRAN